MGSTGEPDRKRRHFSAISPTAASAKKQPLLPLSEDKKLDTAVLLYQNQKLVQKLEAQKVECIALENKFCQLKEKQQHYDETLAVVNEAWEQLAHGLESCSICTKGSMSSGRDAKTQSITEDGTLYSPVDAFLSRLSETGATESSSAFNSLNQNKEDTQKAIERSKNILRNIVTAIDDLWYKKDGLQATVLKAIPEDGSCRQKISTDLQKEVRNLRVALGDLHLKHKSLATELQCHRDTDAKNKAELKRLRVELESTVAELEESNCKLAALKTDRDAAKGAFFPVLNFANKPVAVDVAKDKQKDLQDMESSIKELLDQASHRLLELQHLHEDRIGILKQLSDLQNTLKDVKGISSSQAYVLLRNELAKSKVDLVQYQALFEKLQVEKDNLAWREKEMNIKNDLLDGLHRNSVLADFRITELETEIQKQISERNLIETRLGEASKEPGRKGIIAEFKALVSSFPEDMGNMQSQLSTYKGTASDIHSLRADVQSLSTVLDRKAKELETLSARSADQVAEMQKLQAVVCDLKGSDLELKLILEMYRRESTDSREVLEARDSEYKAWACVQSLKSSLDEHNLELRVKTAIEAEASSQQRLAAAEAEIADLRQKLEASKREKSRLSDILKSKHEENEAYLSEIESIGQAYDDMQTQNQHLMQQITERDDYNIKLVLEGVRARQLQGALLMENDSMQKAIQRTRESVDFYDMKAARIEEQFKMCSDQVQKLAEDRFQSLATLENTQKKLLDVRKSSLQLRESLERSQSKVEKSRVGLAGLQIDLEKERFDKKRLEEELEIVRRKVSRLKSQMDGSSVVEKLQQELREYREILKCSICLDRPKEVVITKCYHLFCNPCVQRVLESRHRKCTVCSASFGANDVKPVYI
ncbi:E3 ubiquitin-protein ligase BRE1-like [Actinidia chinensis var. chinensis]|uniref:E3 ubiquitin protein ligase n=1 Tax=Actinidia chinensis var. chinensis TaxID=1590841 RepID=A0A2R6R991_ACTCC|nr:E3 ubiquitin-protein ligase BRE1-like [Actinidia chinensis var. chinensis]